MSGREGKCANAMRHCEMPYSAHSRPSMTSVVLNTLGNTAQCSVSSFPRVGSIVPRCLIPIVISRLVRRCHWIWALKARSGRICRSVSPLLRNACFIEKNNTSQRVARAVYHVSFNRKYCVGSRSFSGISIRFSCMAFYPHIGHSANAIA